MLHHAYILMLHRGLVVTIAKRAKHVTSISFMTYYISRLVSGNKARLSRHRCTALLSDYNINVECSVYSAALPTTTSDQSLTVDIIFAQVKFKKDNSSANSLQLLLVQP